MARKCSCYYGLSYTGVPKNKEKLPIKLLDILRKKVRMAFDIYDGPSGLEPEEEKEREQAANDAERVLSNPDMELEYRESGIPLRPHNCERLERSILKIYDWHIQKGKVNTEHKQTDNAVHIDEIENRLKEKSNAKATTKGKVTTSSQKSNVIKQRSTVRQEKRKKGSSNTSEIPSAKEISKTGIKTRSQTKQQHEEQKPSNAPAMSSSKQSHHKSTSNKEVITTKESLLNTSSTKNLYKLPIKDTAATNTSTNTRSGITRSPTSKKDIMKSTLINKKDAKTLSPIINRDVTNPIGQLTPVSATIETLLTKIDQSTPILMKNEQQKTQTQPNELKQQVQHSPENYQAELVTSTPSRTIIDFEATTPELLSSPEYFFTPPVDIYTGMRPLIEAHPKDLLLGSSTEMDITPTTPIGSDIIRMQSDHSDNEVEEARSPSVYSIHSGKHPSPIRSTDSLFSRRGGRATVSKHSPTGSTDSFKSDGQTGYQYSPQLTDSPVSKERENISSITESSPRSTERELRGKIITIGSDTDSNRSSKSDRINKDLDKGHKDVTARTDNKLTPSIPSTSTSVYAPATSKKRQRAAHLLTRKIKSAAPMTSLELAAKLVARKMETIKQSTSTPLTEKRSPRKGATKRQRDSESKKTSPQQSKKQKRNLKRYIPEGAIVDRVTSWKNRNGVVSFETYINDLDTSIMIRAEEMIELNPTAFRRFLLHANAYKGPSGKYDRRSLKHLLKAAPEIGRILKPYNIERNLDADAILKQFEEEELKNKLEQTDKDDDSNAKNAESDNNTNDDKSSSASDTEHDNQ